MSDSFESGLLLSFLEASDEGALLAPAYLGHLSGADRFDAATDPETTFSMFGKRHAFTPTSTPTMPAAVVSSDDLALAAAEPPGAPAAADFELAGLSPIESPFPPFSPPLSRDTSAQ